MSRFRLLLFAAAVLSAQSDEPVGLAQGVTSPRLLQKEEPQYSEQARTNGVQGTVVLQIVVNTKGSATDITLLHPLGYGLDEEAIRAVEQWRFQPGLKGDRPVNVLATVEVNFRLRTTEKRRSAFSRALQRTENGAKPEEVGRAVKEILTLADRKFPPAMYTVGVWKVNGDHVPKDVAAGLELIQMAAAKDYGPAMYDLATRFMDGRDVPKNDVIGLDRMRQAAVLGIEKAQFLLGSLYEKGDQVALDLNQSRRYFRLCAAKGAAQCEYRLGRSLYEAPGRKQREYMQAIALLQLAAEQGIEDAKTLVEAENPKLNAAQIKTVSTLKGQIARK